MSQTAGPGPDHGPDALAGLSGPVRVGVYGGAFDPPHAAHAALALAAIDQLGLDRLLVLPTGQPWHRPGAVSPVQHRLAMSRLAFDGLPRVRVDDRETRRAGPSYTVDTLTELRALAPQARWWLIIGQDQWQGLARWHRAAELPGLATLCVAARPQISAESLHLPAGVHRLELPAMPHSATDIRARVAQGMGIDHLVAPAVARYIAEHQLYRSA